MNNYSPENDNNASEYYKPLFKKNENSTANLLVL